MRCADDVQAAAPALVTCFMQIPRLAAIPEMECFAKTNKRNKSKRINVRIIDIDEVKSGQPSPGHPIHIIAQQNVKFHDFYSQSN